MSVAALLTLGGAMGSAAPAVDNKTQHVVTSFIFMIYWISFLDVLISIRVSIGMSIHTCIYEYLCLYRVL